jgi:hypothetical protein
MFAELLRVRPDTTYATKPAEFLQFLVGWLACDPLRAMSLPARRGLSPREEGR